VHVGGQGGVELFVKGLALPEGSDLLDDDLRVLGGDGRGGLGAGGEVAHRDVQEVAVQFRIENAVTAVATGATQKQLVVLDIYGHVLGDVTEGLGPAQDKRLSLGLLHGLGEIQRPFDIDAGLLSVEAFEHLENTTVCLAKFILFAFHLVVKTLLLW
jgi:hypothetical protein